MVEVVGNLRFFVTVFGSLVIMVIGSKWWEVMTAVWVGIGWIGVNFLLDAIFRLTIKDWRERDWFSNPVSRVGEGRYMVFLLLMAGFWTSFNQLFITVPEYIRDYTNTDSIAQTLDSFLGLFGGNVEQGDPYWFDHGKIKPEYLINLNAFGIICLQVVISWLARNIRPLATIISGIVVTILSFLVFLGGAEGWFVVMGILVFSVGEMLASPKSKQYAGLIAPPDKVGMYMGYFYWCTALGNPLRGYSQRADLRALRPHRQRQPRNAMVDLRLLRRPDRGGPAGLQLVGRRGQAVRGSSLTLHRSWTREVPGLDEPRDFFLPKAVGAPPMDAGLSPSRCHPCAAAGRTCRRAGR